MNNIYNVLSSEDFCYGLNKRQHWYALHQHMWYLEILVSKQFILRFVLINMLQDHDNASSCPPVTHSLGSWICPWGHPCCTHHFWIHVRHLHRFLSWWLTLAIKTSIMNQLKLNEGVVMLVAIFWFYDSCQSLSFVANELDTWLEKIIEIVWYLLAHVIIVINLLYLLKTSFSIVFKVNFVDNHSFIPYQILIFIFGFSLS